MTREALTEAVLKDSKASGVQLYIGKDGVGDVPGMESMKFTDDFEEGPYFYAPVGGFQLLYPHAKPVGVASPDSDSIYWSDMDEALAGLPA